MKQGTSEVPLEVDSMREETRLEVGEARQLVSSPCNIVSSFGVTCQNNLLKEELVAVRKECEGRTEVVKTKVEKVKMTRLRHLSKNSLSACGNGLSVLSQRGRIVPIHAQNLGTSASATI
ncbi:hypothetical protein E2C01_081981 [Portunus trituberculatus]|uniref:Uncharacterized protein n=1 Tax=Portunus trituberculatus TaxID=210409 RepID=A0A5B7IR67_PORTR|nr:hypothetical protein [Portunus trituberculatus]